MGYGYLTSFSKTCQTIYFWLIDYLLLNVLWKIFRSHMIWCFFVCSVSSVKMRGDCLFCWYWWNWWPSLFKLSFHNIEDNIIKLWRNWESNETTCTTTFDCNCRGIWSWIVMKNLVFCSGYNMPTLFLNL